MRRKAAKTARKKIARKPIARKKIASKKAAPMKPAKRVAKQTTAPTKKPIADLERELKRERAARRRLEKQLTALVQELGHVRHYEARSRVLEEELRRRDEELSTFRRAAGVVAGQAELPLGAP